MAPSFECLMRFKECSRRFPAVVGHGAVHLLLMEPSLSRWFFVGADQQRKRQGCLACNGASGNHRATGTARLIHSHLKLALVAPSTKTLEGTDTSAGLLLCRFIDIPTSGLFAGTGELARFKVQLVVDAQVTEEPATAMLTPMARVRSPAVMTEHPLATVAAGENTVNCVPVLLAVIVLLGASDVAIAGSLLDRLTVNSPCGAGALRAT